MVSPVSHSKEKEKEGCVDFYFRHHRQRGPVSALRQLLAGLAKSGI
jgi:hypothetical protein